MNGLTKHTIRLPEGYFDRLSTLFPGVPPTLTIRAIVSELVEKNRLTLTPDEILKILHRHDS